MARRKTILDAACQWESDDADPHGHNKRALLDYLLAHAVGISHVVPISRVLTKAKFSRKYRREALQQQLIVPLRAEGRVFIGTSNRGIYLLDKPEDAEETINFYATRIRSELRHVRNVKALARRYGLFKGYKPKKPASGGTLIYFDESGTPSLADMKTQPLFIVAAIVIDDRRVLTDLPQRLKFIAELLHKPANYEFKSTKLSCKEYPKVLHELSVVDFQWAAVCFVKRRLTSKGFRDATTFYKYACQFLAGDLLSISTRTELFFDEYGKSQSKFDHQFQAYMKDRNAGLPPAHLKSIAMLPSGKEPLIQLADLVAGVVKKAARGQDDLLYLIEDKAIDVHIFPPR